MLLDRKVLKVPRVLLVPQELLDRLGLQPWNLANFCLTSCYALDFMILIDSSRSLEVVLTAAKTTNDMPVVGAFVNHNSSFSVTALTPIVTNTNGSTVVTLVASPSSGEVRQVKTVTIHNLDTAGKTVKVQINTSGTKSIIIKADLDVGDTLQYSDIDGWFTLNSIGQVKTGASIALEDDSVVTAKILNANVTNAKLANMTNSTLKGRITSGSGAPEDLSAASVFSIIKGVIPVAYSFAVTDETNPITVGNDKVLGIRIPFAMSLVSISGSLGVAQASGNALTVNIRRSATSLFSTNMSFANTVRTSTNAVLTTNPTALALGDEIIPDVTQIGASGAKGLKITLHGFMA